MARLSALLCLLALLGLCAAALPQTVNHCGTDAVVTVRETPISGFVDSLMGLKWLTNEVVYARSVVHDLTSVRSVLYRSEDSGKTWTNEMSKLKNSNDGVYEVLTTATDGKAWITGFGAFLWVTTDAGASYQTVNIPQGETMVAELIPHPYLSDYALITTQTSNKGDYYMSLYSTTNFGASWTLVDKYVSVAQYAVEGLSGGVWVFNHTIIYTALAETYKKGSQSYDVRKYAVYHTEDFGKTKHVIRENTPGLLVHQDAFFIAGWTSDPKSALTLYVSIDGGSTFKQCVFPHDEILSELNYIIMQASYGSSMVFVLHSLKNAWGNIYASDSFDQTFELSLSFVVSYQKNGYGISLPDYMSISRLPGLYLANVWDVGTAAGPTINTPIVTLMTRNNGGTWRPIAPPRGSSCGGAKSCSLMLRGPRSSTYGAFYSDPDAIGLVVGNGNVGTALDSNTPPTTFISRDAGLTWFAVDDIGEGNKTYEWADHGALFIAANTGVATNRVFYSILEGEQFVECNYTGDDIKVKRNIIDIYNDPKMETAAFIAVASKPVDNSWVILFFDFRSVFRRTCVGFENPDAPDSDYELWAPAYDDNEACVLGEQTQYVRRKQYAQCFNGEGYEVASNVTACACTIADYRCAECYVSVTNATGTYCVYSKTNCTKEPVAAHVPEPCHGSYFVATGWEKIPLDKCEGTPTGIGKMVACPGMDTTHTLLVVILVLVFLIFGCIGGCWALAKYNPSVREFWSRTVPGIIAPTFGRSNSSNATYSLLKKPDSMDDDEEALAEGSQAKELDDDTILNYSKDGKEGTEKKDSKDSKPEIL